MDNVKRLFSGWFLVVFLIAVVAQILLGVFAPDSKGYAYDDYSRAILIIVNEGRLPNHSDCWICYHPPLFPLVGTILFKLTSIFGGGINAQQYAVSTLTGILSLVMSVYGFLLYQRYRKHEEIDLILWALLLFVPVRFISSFSVEADIFTATLIVMATYYFSIYLQNNALRILLLSGFLIGLATLTKYNGMVVALFFGLVLLWRFLRTRKGQEFKHGIAYALIVFAVGGAHYTSNLVKYDTPFPGNAAWNTGERHFDKYDFTGFGFGRIVATYYRSSPPGGELWHFPSFNNQVITSHFGQLWTDFSFFSVPGRHGMHVFRLIFHGKWVPIALIWAILFAGVLPVLYSGIGFVQLLWQRESMFLMGLFIITIAAYVNWFSGYYIWMLKTKYLLYLLPIWLLFINKFADLAGPRVVAWSILPAVVFSMIYCFVFAIG